MNSFHQRGRFKRIRLFIENARGSTTVEYATLLGLIGATLLPVVQVLGQNSNSVNQEIANILVDAAATEELNSAKPGPAVEFTTAEMKPGTVVQPTTNPLKPVVVDVAL